MDYKEHLLMIVNRIGDSIFVKDREHRYVFVNAKCANNKKAELEDIIGKTDHDFFPKEQADIFWEKDEEVFVSGKENINEEEMTDQHGNNKVILTVKDLYKDEHGNEFIIGSSKDISRLKAAEEKLQKYNDQLEDKVRLRTQQLRQANKSLEVQLQQLNFLNNKAQFFNQLIDKEALLPAVFFAFKECFPKGEIHLCEKTSEGFQSVFSSSRIRECKMKGAGLKALEQVESKGQDLVYYEENWQKNKALAGLFDESFADLPSYVVVPLEIEKKAIGMVQVFTTADFEDSYNQEKTFLSTLGLQAAVSMANCNMYKELGEKTRLQSELEIATNIQKRFIPEEPDITGYKLKGLFQPANEVGGDYLDYFQNDNGDWVFVIADVCGKGVPAALVMTSLRSSLRTEARNCSSSKDIICAVNRFMQPDLVAEHSFITCSCIVLEQSKDEFNYTRAGHPHLILYRDKSEPQLVTPKGVAIGMLPKGTYENYLEERRFSLEPGEIILNYTDGLDEARNNQNECYGLKKLLAFLTNNSASSLENAVEDIIGDVKNFCNNQRQYDDIAIFALEKL